MSIQKVYIKENVSVNEYQMYLVASKIMNLNIPLFYMYCPLNKRMIVKYINALSISDMYGEDIDKVPLNIMIKIRQTILLLFMNDIVYPDITGYNFIYLNNKIWIVDFEHAYKRTVNNCDDDNQLFIKKFINNYQSWNPDFK